VVQRWRRRVLARAFTTWRQHALLQQQYAAIARMVSSRRVNSLLALSWTAWRVGAAHDVHKWAF
jgi:hypothetical protein